MRLRLTIVLILLWTMDTYCQTLDRKEILKEFKANRTIPKLDSIFYDGYHSGARQTFVELLNDDIDTLIVYSFDYPGHTFLTKNDSCSKIRNSYFFWKEQGKYFFSTDNGRCVSLDKVSSSKIVSFGADNFFKIRDEFFMEAVFGAERKGGKIRMSQSWVDHEGKYSLLVLINGQYNWSSLIMD